MYFFACYIGINCLYYENQKRLGIGKHLYDPVRELANTQVTGDWHLFCNTTRNAGMCPRAA
jgi:hypothetical protein